MSRSRYLLGALLLAGFAATTPSRGQEEPQAPEKVPATNTNKDIMMLEEDYLRGLWVNVRADGSCRYIASLFRFVVIHGKEQDNRAICAESRGHLQES